MRKGFGLCLIMVFLWSLGNILKRYVAVEYGVNPVIFSISSLFAASIFLIIAGGPGKLGIATLKNIYSWAYGFFEVLITISVMFLFVYVSSTATSILTQVSVVMICILSFIIFKRRIFLTDIIGSIVILCGIAQVIMNTDQEIMLTVTMITLLSATLVSLRAIITEAHPLSSKAEGIKQRCRVTGYVVLVSSVFFMILFTALSYIKQQYGGDNYIITNIFKTVPNQSDFFDSNSVLAGVIFGILILSLIRYFYFYATKVANSDNLLIFGALTPVITFLFEKIFIACDLLPEHAVTIEYLYWGATISAGSIIMILGRIYFIKYKKLSVKM